MRVQRLLPVLVAFGLLPALATPAMAQRAYRSRSMEHGSEFSPYLTFNQFQSKAELDDEFGAGFRFGYLYTPHHEIEFMLNSVSTKDSVFTSDNVDLTNLQVAYVFNFTKRDVVPYLTAGVGFLHTHDHDLGNETDGVVGLGGGVRFFLGRAFFARFEARENLFSGKGTVYADGEDFANRELLFGVGWRFAAP